MRRSFRVNSQPTRGAGRGKCCNGASAKCRAKSFAFATPHSQASRSEPASGMLTVIVMNSCFVSSAQIVSARLVREVAPDGPSLMWVIFKTTAPYFFIARLKNAQVDRSFPQVPLRFISDGIPYSWRERWADTRAPFRTELRGIGPYQE